MVPRGGPSDERSEARSTHQTADVYARVQTRGRAISFERSHPRAFRRSEYFRTIAALEAATTVKMAAETTLIAMNAAMEAMSSMEAVAVVAKVLNRSVAGQVEYWAKLGKLSEENPDLNYNFIKDILLAKEELKRDKLEEFVL